MQLHPICYTESCQPSHVPVAATLRGYQSDAVAATEEYLASQAGNNPCIVLPTGGGKSHVIAALARNAVDRGQRVLVLAHVKELLEQTHQKLEIAVTGHACPEHRDNQDLGLYSAGLGCRDTDHSIIVAGIQSVYQRAEELGRFGLVIIDEAHLIPPDGEGRYRTLIAACQEINPNIRVAGLTATPYRMTSGPICGPKNILSQVVYDAPITSLIDAGYLSPLVSRAGVVEPDFDSLHLRGGDFRDDEVATLMNTVVQEACTEIVGLTTDRRACLVFAAGVEHGRLVTARLRQLGVSVEFVAGETSTSERDRILGEFKDGRLQFLVNVNIATTGLDVPHIDCVAMLRPTMSPGLYYQMVGRGLRIADGKDDCLILDYAGNVRRHGPIDAIVPDRKPTKRGDAPVKVCPECRSHLNLGARECTHCGFEFTRRQLAKHGTSAEAIGLLTCDPLAQAEHLIDKAYWKGVRLVREGSGGLRCFPRRRVPKALLKDLAKHRDAFLTLLDSASVHQVSHREHVSSRGTTSLMVGYRVGDAWFNEWIHFGATGQLGRLAELWWKDRGGDAPAPANARDALQRRSELCVPSRITTAPNGKYRRVTGWR